ncbi:hypothetical protein ACNRBS_04350 [Ralstonia pseudosolanacearum]|nr:hypothetical protein [Ralstonia pseudosolanacearum]
MFSIEKQAVENFLGEEAQEVSHQSVAGGVLKVWRNIHSLPARRACTFTSQDGSVNVPNSGDDVFFDLLAQAMAAGADQVQLCEIIPLASPVPRKLVLKLQPYLQYLADSWHAPELQRGRFECFVENLASGRVERLAIDASSHETVDVGEGIRFSLR